MAPQFRLHYFGSGYSADEAETEPEFDLDRLAYHLREFNQSGWVVQSDPGPNDTFPNELLRLIYVNRSSREAEPAYQAWVEVVPEPTPARPAVTVGTNVRFDYTGRGGKSFTKHVAATNLSKEIAAHISSARAWQLDPNPTSGCLLRLVSTNQTSEFQVLVVGAAPPAAPPPAPTGNVVTDPAVPNWVKAARAWVADNDEVSERLARVEKEVKDLRESVYGRLVALERPPEGVASLKTLQEAQVANANRIREVSENLTMLVTSTGRAGDLLSSTSDNVRELFTLVRTMEAAARPTDVLVAAPAAPAAAPLKDPALETIVDVLTLVLRELQAGGVVGTPDALDAAARLRALLVP